MNPPAPSWHRQFLCFRGDESRLRRNSTSAVSRGWLPLVAVLLSGAVAGGATGGSPPVIPLHQGAISYFDRACAHCHGPYGSAYGSAFFTKYDLTLLGRSINSMANGPGQSPLDAEGLQAEVAFHQAIITQAPFIDWTSRDGDTFVGEVTRKAALSATARGAAVPVAVSGIHWTLKLPAGASAADVTLTASLKGKTAVWRPTKYPYSLPPKWPPAR